MRSISLSSSIYLNLTTIGLIFAILVITATPTGFPKSDPVLMAILTTFFCLGPALLYGVWTATAPRSGADYVWNSRAFHPWVGFAANFAAVSWFILGNGFLAWDVATDALPTAFYIVGNAFHSSTIIGWGTTVSGKNWAFAIGIVVLVLSAVGCGLGMRRTVRVMTMLLAADRSRRRPFAPDLAVQLAPGLCECRRAKRRQLQPDHQRRGEDWIPHRSLHLRCDSVVDAAPVSRAGILRGERVRRRRAADGADHWSMGPDRRGDHCRFAHHLHVRGG